jgi:mRNA interferase MazF
VKPGDVVLIAMPQIGGIGAKLRPALYLSSLPGPFQTLLICGISSQLHTVLPNWDELIQPGDPDFAPSHLRAASVIRLSFLYAADPGEISGVIGAIDSARHQRLLPRLSDHLRP